MFFFPLFSHLVLKDEAFKQKEKNKIQTVSLNSICNNKVGRGDFSRESRVPNAGRSWAPPPKTFPYQLPSRAGRLLNHPGVNDSNLCTEWGIMSPRSPLTWILLVLWLDAAKYTR